LTAYDPSQWTDLFVASAGASAALAGLVFVAVSINIERILKFEGLPERALETVLMLLLVLVVSITGLIPGQSNTALGLELLAEALFFGAIIARLSLAGLEELAERRSWLATRIAVRAIATVPLIVGGASLLALAGGGLYWIVAGIIGAIAGAVGNAWVLLVEILR
jgi:modulator of FtsH protease